MPDGEAPAQPLLHGVDDPAEQVELGQRVGAAVRVRFIRHGKVGEDALGLQSRRVAGVADTLHAGVKHLPAAQIPQPGHAGVHLDVDFQRAAAFYRLGAVLLRLGGTGHGLGDVQVDQVLHLLPRRVAQDQDGHGDAVVAQLHGLVDAGHRQIVRAQRFQRAGDLNGAVAVAVGLHHPQKFDRRAHVGAQRPIVVGQRVKVDLGPCSPQCRFHLYFLLARSLFWFL